MNSLPASSFKELSGNGIINKHLICLSYFKLTIVLQKCCGEIISSNPNLSLERSGKFRLFLIRLDEIF